MTKAKDMCWQDVAIIPLGRNRQTSRDGYRTGWVQNVEKRGNIAAFELYYEYDEGPNYKQPERYKFAVGCLDTPDNDTIKQLTEALELFRKAKASFFSSDCDDTPEFRELFDKADAIANQALNPTKEGK